jgi:hypothetical protein
MPERHMPSQETTFAADVKQAFAKSKNTDVDGVKKDHWHFESRDNALRVETVSFSFEKSFWLPNGDELDIPPGTVVGEIDFPRKLRGKENYRTLAKGLSEFFTRLDYKAADEPAPELLFSYVDKHDLPFLENRLGFYRDELDKEQQIAATESVREHLLDPEIKQQQELRGVVANIFHEGVVFGSNPEVGLRYPDDLDYDELMSRPYTRVHEIEDVVNWYSAVGEHTFTKVK